MLNASLWAKQQEIIEAVRDHAEVYVPSCHASGKSFTAAHVALWFLYSHPNSIVVTTAPTGRQVKKILWQEIRRAHGKAPVPLGGTLLKQELQIDEKWYAFGFSSDEPTNFSGLHADWVLFIVDEATGIPPESWEAIDGVLSNEHAHLLAIGNPTDGASEFAVRCAKGGPGVAVLPISAYDTPNFTELGIIEADIASGTWEEKVKAADSLPHKYLVAPSWVAKVYKKYGADSAMYLSRVKGKFPTTGKDTLIPLAWIDRAVERWRDHTEKLRDGSATASGEKVLGVDVARFGTDATVRTFREGFYVAWQRETNQEDTMQTAGRVALDLAEKEGMSVNIDVIGLGAGVYDRLKEQGKPVHAINVAEAASDPEMFANLRAEGYWHLRNLFETDAIMIPPDDDLADEITQLKYKVVSSSGKIRIEEKEEMKKRLGRSPDRADSLMLSVITPAQQQEVFAVFGD